MDIKFFLAITSGKIIYHVSRFFNIGSGGTWSGEIAMKLDKDIVQKLFSSLDKSILVAGTNGKTTTSKIIRHLLKNDLVYNDSGANLENGIVGAFIKRKGKIGVFEVDEAVLPIILKKVTPDIVVLLNLFRDQLDRYGEVNTISEKWAKSLSKLSNSSTVILNADDPQIAYLGKKVKAKVKYFGIKKGKEKRKEAWGDSFYCPVCKNKLSFSDFSFSHLGSYKCEKCGFNKPKPNIFIEDLKLPLAGIYNQYNASAAFLAVKELKNEISRSDFEKALSSFQPAFGRGEEVQFRIQNSEFRIVKILLSKNPTGLSENIKIVGGDKNAGAVLLVLNDRIPDGRDVSWIWDVNFSPLVKNSKVIIVSGDRAYDMGTRIKYSHFAKASRDKQNHNSNLKIFNSLKEAIKIGLKETEKDKTFYILPTYSAMLEVRKILLGRKIL